MSSEQPRTGRPPSSGSPAGSTVAIVVAVVAVVVAFFIIKNIRDDDGGGSSTNTTQPPVVTGDPNSTTTVDPNAGTTTTEFTPVVDGSTVQVANAANQDGAAGGLTTQLAALKFKMADATNATVRLPTTIVLYDKNVAGSQNVANSVAHYLGGVTVQEAPSPVQTKDAVLPSGCGVLVMLGADKAGKTIDEMMGVAGTADTTATATT